MRKLLGMVLVLAALGVRSSGADPGVAVTLHDGLVRVTLAGSYPGAWYLVWRSGELVGPYAPMASEPTLCTGDCFLTDLEAIPGHTYWYRFDVQASNGDFVSYGPYAVTIPDTPLGISLGPNPGGGPAVLRLSVPGSARHDAPVEASVRLLDVAGRNVRVLFRGPLARGETTLRWDGAGENGRPLNAGVYFVRMITPLGTTTRRVVRIR